MAVPANFTVVPILGQDNIIVSSSTDAGPGLWDGYLARDLLSNVMKNKAPGAKIAVITDTVLGPLYLDSFRAAFSAACEQLCSNSSQHPTLLDYQITPGESSKSRETVGVVHDWLAQNGCARDTVIVALGGGVVGDMTGFVAATYMRGVSFVQVPTTLLAMVDSSIGGKTAVDTPYGKNLVGAFWQPKRIYVDLRFLTTLPRREFVNGMAEVIKTAAIWNHAEFLALENDASKILEYLDTSHRKTPPSPEVAKIIERLVTASIRVKAEIVSADEREGGLRNLLNFGHSIGHAYEAILAPQILHGECVSVGMVKEAELARYLGLLRQDAVARLTKCIAAYGLPVSLGDTTLRQRSANRNCPVDELLRLMAVDKKNEGSHKRIVLLSDIGKTHEKQATAVSDNNIRLVLSAGVVVSPSASIPKSVTCTPPGSKSISNRALVLAALGKGQCRLTNMLHSDDTQVMLTALRKLGAAEFTWENNGQVLLVNGKGATLQACREQLYLGNAGTASRFLTTAALLAAATKDSQSVTLTGNGRMKERPIGPLVDSLRENGARIVYIEKQGSLPLEIDAIGGLPGGEINLAATVSSQYVSSILMCAPYAKKPVTLRLIGGKPVSQLYIDMTIAMMGSFGVQVEKSATEEHTYHIPAQAYQNPAEYEIESDASSATYPLAVAAITGTECTISNIGSASLQGDARFAVDVLEPMGCSVSQTKISTTVKGPAPGGLLPLSSIDMEPMTDSFLTACVLAAVACKQNESSTTVIYGISNQHVKECDRIEAMKTELVSFGVNCRTSEDGIEIDGRGLKLDTPSKDIHCYDDHRVAMSFSVLAMSQSFPTSLDDRLCVAKTWPAWWDFLKAQYGANLEGYTPKSSAIHSVHSFHAPRKSIFLIGMRGAGKTTTGRWCQSILHRPFIDLDEMFEPWTGMDVATYVRRQGWDSFRDKEAEHLRKVMREYPNDYVFACGGGVVETLECRKALVEWHKGGGIVINISRSIEWIIDYLQQDKTRPAYTEEIEGVWLRRKAWYQECSNFEYYSCDMDEEAHIERIEKEKFAIFIRHITAPASEHPLQTIKALDHSFFLSLTIPIYDRTKIEKLKAIAVGSHAVELRADLLKDPDVQGTLRPEFLVHQYSFLRSVLPDVPIIFTIRTRGQGGSFPDNAVAEATELYMTALRLGVEFLDLEVAWPETLIETVLSAKRNTKIIASHHDPTGQLSWSNGSWIVHYNRALQTGDLVKLVGVANSVHDNDQLEHFRQWATLSHPDVPVILLNMGEVGKLSRIRNYFFTPVTHEKLTAKAAPGQLSARQICQARAMMGIIRQKSFWLWGSPINLSPSPALHNTIFEEIGLPHRYFRFKSVCIADGLRKISRMDDFGGASVTIPLKQDLFPIIDDVPDYVRAIGALNTIVPVFVNEGKRKKYGVDGVYKRVTNSVILRAQNTDWSGIRDVLHRWQAIVSVGPSQPLPKARNLSFDRTAKTTPALVIGAGGTARAALFALLSMGYSPVYVVGRTRSKLEEVREVAEYFSPSYVAPREDYDLVDDNNEDVLENGDRHLVNGNAPLSASLLDKRRWKPLEEVVPIISSAIELETAGILQNPPVAAVGTIPANAPIDSGLVPMLKRIFAARSSSSEGLSSTSGAKCPSILLDMAYIPAHTELMQLVEAAGTGRWRTVGGAEALTAQGTRQSEYWFGLLPRWEMAREAVRSAGQANDIES